MTIDASSKRTHDLYTNPAHPLQHTHKMKRAISDAPKFLVCFWKEGQYEGTRTGGQRETRETQRPELKKKREAKHSDLSLRWSGGIKSSTRNRRPAH